MGLETWVFSNEPCRLESTINTTEFLEEFPLIFQNNAHPNAAFTFGGAAIPLIAILPVEADSATRGQPSDDGTSIRVQHSLDQSGQQQDLLSLEVLLLPDDGDQVVFPDCSLFIDDLQCCCEACDPINSLDRSCACAGSSSSHCQTFCANDFK
ncbi:expressed unknown protein [Seminavis robusta]|uniref:Uncharacterized protein n=1 Tax=Seminavis robusta TaxID=568900 RepID=A0A9N8EQ33_9STRA|nr:expressed unknown protein [Seminavis robusta]|eukprot:Sro1640_g287950.1 n/a (153) ;mRNA; f:20675-21133